MISSARAAANAANAQLSIGPRTEEGKARSSRNAVKHGLTSKRVVIAPGEEEEFAELHDSLLDQLAPEGALEVTLFHMIVHAAWNLQRFRTLEAQLMANGLESLFDERTSKALDRLQRYAAANQRSYFTALKQLRIAQNNRVLRRTLDGHDYNELPELVSLAELAKQTQQCVADCDMAAWLVEKARSEAPLPRGLQNEAMPDLGRFRAQSLDRDGRLNVSAK
jgi:hypothetical protein